jgi:hypothetical protein
MDHKVVSRVARSLGVGVAVPEACGELVGRVVESYRGRPEDFETWFARELLDRFRAFGERPNWIQEPEWPVEDEQPLTFVGQVERPRGTYAGQYYGHDAAYYVFTDMRTAKCTVVVQAD